MIIGVETETSYYLLHKNLRHQRDKRSVSKIVEKYSRINPTTGGFDIPPLAEILTQRIVVVTCISGGQLYSMGVPPGHFTHFCIDEAGMTSIFECTFKC